MDVEFNLSPERLAKIKERDEQRKAHEKKLLRLSARVWLDFDRWMSISECPFKSYAESYAAAAQLFVTDGKHVALVRVSKRCGRPMKVINPGRLVFEDDALPVLKDAVYEEYNHPKWWFDWELEDLLADEHPLYGHPEIDFVPTKFLPFFLPEEELERLRAELAQRSA